MGHDGVASGYPTPTGFRKLTGCQRDPQNRGVTLWDCFEHLQTVLRIGFGSWD